jgi:hypothetical protein
MITRIPQLLLAATCVVILGACHDDGLNNHSCPLSYSTDWGGHGLNVDHTEPDKCPVYIPEPGTIKTTGAIVFDGGAEEFESAFLDVKDFSGDNVGGPIRPDFQRTSEGRWAAPVYVDYKAGQDALAPDKANFQLVYKGVLPGPKATMTITYRSDVLVSISGPGVVASGTSETYRASPDGGEAPFTYEWYRDWELVSTSDSYTDIFDGDGSVFLRLDVIDARGMAASTFLDIWVSSCLPQVVC